MVSRVRARTIADSLEAFTQRAEPLLKRHTAEVVLFFTTWAAVIYYAWDVTIQVRRVGGADGR